MKKQGKVTQITFPELLPDGLFIKKNIDDIARKDGFNTLNWYNA